jgi:hypothetical protein
VTAAAAAAAAGCRWVLQLANAESATAVKHLLLLLLLFVAAAGLVDVAAFLAFLSAILQLP